MIVEIKIVLLLCFLVQNVCGNDKPNIVFIMADDLGWNDVSFHGSDQILTPNIDALAYNGVILNRFYTSPICTPSRSSLMTGKYPNRLGMHHYVIPNDAPYGLGLDQKIMPQYLKEASYRTHLIGKWHLGFYQKAYTPTMRGFDSFLGYYGGYIDYYDKTLKMFERNYSRGYDLRKNLTLNYEIPPETYVTDLLTDEAVQTIHNHNYENPLFLLLLHLAPHAGNDDKPLQAPQTKIDQFNYIEDENRRIYAAMVSKLDESVGRVFKALKDREVLENTVLVFISDNGGMTRGLHGNSASNHPLRGQKFGTWEGGVRNVALIYSPLITAKQRVSNELMHITDFLPTFASLAGIEIPGEIDGIDQWQMISNGAQSKRKEILHSTDPIDNFSSLMFENWKLVNGTTFNGIHDGWLGKIEDFSIDSEDYVTRIQESAIGEAIKGSSSPKILEMRKEASLTCPTINIGPNIICEPLKSPCLFNIVNDPCEQVNVAETEPEILEILQLKLQAHIEKSIEPRNKKGDYRADPANFHGAWTWWLDQEDDLHKEL